jgi:3-isopropylmalate/(R)-2-methylmalate dehydratase large subunit
MGKTLTEKIIARVSGRDEVHPGEIVWVTPDLTTAYDYLGLDYVTPDIESLGAPRVKNPERIALFIDHHCPPRSAAEAETHVQTRAWAKKHGVRLFEGLGIGHQVMVELGLARPGMFVASHDTQVTGAGGVGALAVGSLPLLEIYTRGKTWIKVPETIRYNLSGTLPKGVTARDVMHFIVSEIGPDGALYRAMEFGGPTVSGMSIDERFTLCNIANHPGAKAAVVNPDEKTIEYVKSRTSEPFEAVSSDSDAKYEKVLNFDISDLEPYVAAPSEVYNCKPLHQFEGTPLDMGYIGSCAGGRLDELRAAASILKGKRVKPGFKLYIVPTSAEIMQKANRERLVSTFIEAGASVFAPTCDFCWGALGAMAAGQTGMTTGTLNITGRMGSNDSKIFLASACAIAASAIEGRIADPRRYV